MHLAIAEHKNGSERVIAIDAHRSRPDPDLAHQLSKTITTVRKLLGA